MRRILTVLAVTALMAAMMVATAMPAFAFANSNNKGKSDARPGQEKAMEGCYKFFDNHEEDPPGNGNGKKQGEEYPTNCDHYFIPGPPE